MEVRRSNWGAAIRLAILLSVVAAATAIAVHSFGDVPETFIVLSVIVVGFVTSWVRTGRASHGEALAHRHHRVVTVPVHGAHPVG